MASSSHTYSLLVPLLLLLSLAPASCSSEALPLPVDPTCPPEPTTTSAAPGVPSGYSDDPRCRPPPPHIPVAVFPYDVDPMQFALNLEYTEAEFFLHAAYGVGLDHLAPGLALGGPPPVGARKANLDEVTWRIVAEFGLQEIGHIRY